MRWSASDTRARGDSPNNNNNTDAAFSSCDLGARFFDISIDLCARRKWPDRTTSLGYIIKNPAATTNPPMSPTPCSVLALPIAVCDGGEDEGAPAEGTDVEDAEAELAGAELLVCVSFRHCLFVSLLTYAASGVYDGKGPRLPVPEGYVDEWLPAPTGTMLDSSTL